MANYEYSPDRYDDIIFASGAPVDLWTETIEAQFKEPLENRKIDHVDGFFTKNNFERNELDESEDEDAITATSMDNEYMQFVRFMVRMFDEYLHLGFPNIDDDRSEDVEEIIHLTYRFFIKNIKKNFVNYIINIIDHYRDTIEEKFEMRDDVTVQSFRNEINNDYDILVLSQLKYIIKYALSPEFTEEMDIDDFFDLCEGDSLSLELEFVRSKFETDDITGNFIRSYCDMIAGDDEAISEIQSKVRNKILKKYPKRKSKTVDKRTL